MYYTLARMGGIMRERISKRVSIVLVALLLLVVIVACSLTLSNSVAFAGGSETINQVDSLTIGHVSDIHYFPLEHCYPGVHNDDYYDSDFYGSATGDTKLVLESGLIMNKQIREMIEDAKAGIAPQYLFASGDLSKNGETAALIDVANSLRYLQNEMRKIAGYENFQVFAMVGNHDLYNHSGALYSQVDGSKSVSDSITTAQFALIFAGLGFPNANLDGSDGAINLTDYLPADYWATSYTSGYQASHNATNLDITYYNEHLANVENKSTSLDKLNEYLQIGDDIQNLTFTAVPTDVHTGYFFAVIDGADREVLPKNEGSLSRVSALELDSLTDDYAYYTTNADGTINDKYTLTKSAIIDMVQAGEPVFRTTGRNHYTGGRVSEPVLNWIENQIAKYDGDSLSEMTSIAVVHQNPLPHWDQQDEILKDFTLYNWEFVVNRFLDMGIRYTLSGHMHATDVEKYTDEEGRTLFDFETGSYVSYASPRRYLTITRENCDGNLGESIASTVYSIDNIKELASDNIATAPAWDDMAYQSAITAYNANPTPENWQAVLDTNPDYLTYILRYSELSTLTFNEFSSKDIYSILVDRMLGHFVNLDLIDSLKGMLGDFILGSDSTMVNLIMGMVGGKDALHGAAMYLIDTLVYNLYPNGEYVYEGKTYENVIDYVLAVVEVVLNFEYGDENIISSVNPQNAGKLNVKQIASYIMTGHAEGTEVSLKETYDSIDAQYKEKLAPSEDANWAWELPTDATYRKRMLAALKDMSEQLTSGKFVKDLIDTILNPLFVNDDSLLKTLFEYDFDFRNAVDEGYMTEDEYLDFKEGLGNVAGLLKHPLVANLLKGFGIEITLPEGFTIDVDNFELNSLVNELLPALKPLVGDLLGFNLVGDSIFGIVQGFLDSYLVDSFYVGLGGIANDIIMAFATDVMLDHVDNTDTSIPFVLQPHDEYEYANTALSYLSTLNRVSIVNAEFNRATQENGRVPSKITSHFDNANPTSAYSVKFYTNENVFGTFRLYDLQGNLIGEVSTTLEEANLAYASNPTDYRLVTSTDTFGDVTITITTQTKPQYIPLIDLGLLCITHAEVSYEDEDGNEIPFVWGDRDNAVTNSVIYFNETTVTIEGLEANTSYNYDVVGNYADVNGDLHYFALSDYKEEYCKMQTAADDSVDSFEFLAIADIQGMISGMYKDSAKALDALLADERTQNFDFVLNAGDMADNGKNFNQWGMALDTYSKLFANSPMFFAAGNHEGGSNALNKYFNYTLPAVKNADGVETAQPTLDGAYYSFDYANAHFVVLNTNDTDANGLGAVQLAWLVNDLASSDAKWKFVLMHKSLFSGGSHSKDAEVVAMREQLVPIFANNGVNMVFAGHDHVYTSTTLVDANGKASTSIGDSARYTGEGVVYITLGTMGTKYYNYQENGEISDMFDEDKSVLETLSTQTFGKVVVEGDTITYTAFSFNQTTNEIEEIATTILTSVPSNNTLVIVLGVVGGVIGAGFITAIVLVICYNNGLLKRKPKVAVENADAPSDVPTEE